MSSPKSPPRPRAGSGSAPRGRTGSITSIGSYMLSLSGDENSDQSDDFIVAPVFDDDPLFPERSDVESGGSHHLQTSTNAFYDNLNDIETSEQQEEPL